MIRKVLKTITLGVLMALMVAGFVLPAYAGTPHTSWGIVSGGQTTDTWALYVVARPGETLTANLGDAGGQFFYQALVGNFPSPWADNDDSIVFVARETGAGTNGHAGFFAVMNEDLSVTTNPQQYNDCTVRAIPTPTAAAGNGEVNLTWTAAGTDTSETPHANNILRYRVYRSTSQSSGFTFIGNATGTSYDDTSGTDGTTYYYTIEPVFRGAVELGVYSANSNGIAFPPPAVNPQVTGINPTSGDQGTTVPVTISGTNTTWTGGETITVAPATGITVSNVAATNGTTLTADFVIDAAAPLTARTITVSGAQGSATFTVTDPGAGGGLTVTPNTDVYIGQTIVVTGSSITATVGTITVGGVSANPTAWTAGSVTCAVPSGATTGDVVIGTDTGAITIATGGVIIDDFEGGSVGSYATGMVNSGYYSYPLGTTAITPADINADGPQASAASHGIRGMNLIYSYTSDWGAGWGAGLSNTLDIDAYKDDTLTFYINWDGSSNTIKLALKDINDVVYAATVSNLSLDQTGYHPVQVNASSFAWDADDPANVAGTLDWSQIVSYGFNYTTQGISANYQNIDSFYAGTVIFVDGPVIPTLEGEVIITQIDPPAGPAGTKFTGIGSGFGASQGQSVLIFENNTTHTSYQCDILSWSDTSIEAIVPRLAPAGNYTLKVIRLAIAQGTIQAYESNPAAFKVTSGSSSTGTATIFPNPFNPLETTVPVTRASGLSGAHATIAYDATGVTTIGIYIYDMTARLVYHNITTDGEVTWDGTNMSGSHVADGLYILRVVNEENKSLISKGKILVIKQ